MKAAQQSSGVGSMVMPIMFDEDLFTGTSNPWLLTSP
jgi:hypothetical protein